MWPFRSPADRLRSQIKGASDFQRRLAIAAQGVAAARSRARDERRALYRAIALGWSECTEENHPGSSLLKMSSEPEALQVEIATEAINVLSAGTVGAGEQLVWTYKEPARSELLRMVVKKYLHAALSPDYDISTSLVLWEKGKSVDEQARLGLGAELKRCAMEWESRGIDRPKRLREAALASLHLNRAESWEANVSFGAIRMLGELDDKGVLVLVELIEDYFVARRTLPTNEAGRVRLGRHRWWAQQAKQSLDSIPTALAKEKSASVGARFMEEGASL